MSNSNNQEITFEEAVNAISRKTDNGGFDPQEQKLEKTAKNETNDMML